MRLFYLILSALLLSTTLTAQQTNYFKAIHGGDPVAIFPDTEDVVQDTNGDFIVLVSRRSPGGDSRNIVLYRVAAVTASVIDSVEVVRPLPQQGVSITTDANGHFWVAATELLVDENDHSDILLVEFDQDLTLLQSFVYDDNRYESPVEIISTSANSVSVLVNRRFSTADAFDTELLTVSSEDGSFISGIDLSSQISFIRTFISLAAGAPDKAMVLISGFGADAITVDTQLGIIEAESDPSANCDGTNNFPRTRNLIFDGTHYLTLDDCFNLYRMGQDGNFTVTVADFGTQSPFTANEELFIQLRGDTLEVFEIFSLHTFLLDGNSLEYLSTDPLGFFVSRSINAVSSTEYSILFRPNDEPRLLAIYNTNTTEEVDVTDLDHLVNQSSIFIGRGAGIGSDEIIIAEDLTNGFNILYYDLFGILLDSLNISAAGERDAQVFSAGADGNYRAVIYDTNEEERVDVITFNREDGILDTIFSKDEVNVIGTLYTDAKVSSGGDLYFAYGAIEGSTFGRKFIGLDPTGNQIFDAFFPDLQNYSMFIEQFDVDDQGNVYSVRTRSSRDTILLQQWSDGGTNTQQWRIGHELEELYDIWTIAVNGAGTRLVFGATANSVTTNGVTVVFVEVDLMSGEIIRIEALPTLMATTGTVQMAYQPGSNNIIMLDVRLDADAILNEQFETVFSVYDDTGLFYEEIISRDRNQTIPYEALLADPFRAYFTGTTANNINVRKSFLIGVDYDQVVSVEEVPDLEGATDLRVYPNPAIDRSLITWTNPVHGSSYDLRLLMPDGRPLRRWLGELPIGRANLDIDLSRLPAGTYLVRLQTEAGVTTQRIVKQ